MWKIEIERSNLRRRDIICTYSEKSYKQFLKKNNYKLVQVARGKRKNGVYRINHIDSLNNNLKNLLISLDTYQQCI